MTLEEKEGLLELICVLVRCKISLDDEEGILSSAIKLEEEANSKEEELMEEENVDEEEIEKWNNVGMKATQLVKEMLKKKGKRIGFGRLLEEKEEEKKRREEAEERERIAEKEAETQLGRAKHTEQALEDMLKEKEVAKKRETELLKRLQHRERTERIDPQTTSPSQQRSTPKSPLSFLERIKRVEQISDYSHSEDKIEVKKESIRHGSTSSNLSIILDYQKQLLGELGMTIK